MKIVFAQGNPDAKYERTRHNTGFLALDVIGDTYGATWKDESKYRARIASVQVRGEKVLLVKPLSYYNDTGLVARQLTDFYKLDPATDFLVLHDDLALPLGTVRVRFDGSDAGNNGIKSLNQHLGQQYARIRIGIWSELRDKMDDVTFVLGNFSKNEHEKLAKDVFPKVTELTKAFVGSALELSSYKL